MDLDLIAPSGSAFSFSKLEMKITLPANSNELGTTPLSSKLNASSGLTSLGSYTALVFF